MDSADHLVEQAVAVLRRNDVAGYTKPSGRLYPHQWNWDSAFVAIGLAHVDWLRAAREIETLLSGRWTNGMIPHIRYNPAVKEYAPGPEWWPEVPVVDRSQITSGISQPPVLPSAVYAVGLLQPDVDRRRRWWEQVYGPLRDFLLYFARERTVAGSPLIVVVHPWESGADNSPRWDFAAGRGFRPSRPYRRVDTTVVDPAARPTARDYDLYMYLVELIAAHHYDLAGYLPTTPFAVYDALFNAAWYRSALDLNLIASVLGRPPAFGEDALAAFRAAYRRTLWDDQAHLFRDYDVKTQRPIPVNTVAGLMAIYAGLVDAPEAEMMVNEYRGQCSLCLALPSAPPDQPGFDPMKYWRGPVWVCINWMLIRGLQHLGLVPQGESLRAGTLDLVARAGFFEYFHAYSGEGLGGSDFSWSAALTVDLLRRPEGAA
ncbi:MAG TPA: trehalase family glycosidase [bacterium]